MSIDITHGHDDGVGVDGVALGLGAALRDEAGVGAQAGQGGRGGHGRQPGRPEAAGRTVDVVVQLVAVPHRARQREDDAVDHAGGKSGNGVTQKCEDSINTLRE